MSPTRNAPTAAEAPTSSASPATTSVVPSTRSSSCSGSGCVSSRPMREPQRRVAVNAAITAPTATSIPSAACHAGAAGGQDGQQREVGRHGEVLEHQHRQHRGRLPVAHAAQVVEHPGDDAGGGDPGRPGEGQDSDRRQPEQPARDGARCRVQHEVDHRGGQVAVEAGGEVRRPRTPGRGSAAGARRRSCRRSRRTPRRLARVRCRPRRGRAPRAGRAAPASGRTVGRERRARSARPG